LSAKAKIWHGYFAVRIRSYFARLLSPDGSDSVDVSGCRLSKIVTRGQTKGIQNVASEIRAICPRATLRDGCIRVGRSGVSSGFIGKCGACVNTLGSGAPTIGIRVVRLGSALLVFSGIPCLVADLCFSRGVHVAAWEGGGLRWWRVTATGKWSRAPSRVQRRSIVAVWRR